MSRNRWILAGAAVVTAAGALLVAIGALIALAGLLAGSILQRRK